MTKFLSRVMAPLVALFLLVVSAGPTFAQTALTSTTTVASIADSSSKVFQLTSATGITASSASVTNLLLIDKELMQVQAVTGTYVTVIRGVGGTRATPHIAASIVYFGVPSAFSSFMLNGGCTRANLPYVPVIVSGDADPWNNGTTFDCLGGQWVSTSGAGPAELGTTVASAATIAATGTYFKVSGVAAIATITVPAGWAPGMALTIEPTGIFTTTTGGNIILASTAVVGKALIMTWSGTKWVPSY